MINLAAQLVNAVVEPAVQPRPAEEQALVLAATIELEHLLMDNGLHLSTTPASEVVLSDAFLRRLATMLFDVWQRTLSENIHCANPAYQNQEISVSESTIARLRSLLTEWHRHSVFLAAI